MDFTVEISRNMLDNAEDLTENRMTKVEALKAGKCKLKRALTRQLNELASQAAGVLKKLEKLKLLWSVWKRLRKKLSKYWKNYGHCIRS